MACYRFYRFDSQTLEEITAIWEEYVLKLPQPSNLTSAAVQKVLGASTRGYLGPLDEMEAFRSPTSTASRAIAD